MSKAKVERSGFMYWRSLEPFPAEELPNEEAIKSIFDNLKSQLKNDIPEGVAGTFRTSADYRVDDRSYSLLVEWVPDEESEDPTDG